MKKRLGERKWSWNRDCETDYCFYKDREIKYIFKDFVNNIICKIFSPNNWKENVKK